MAITMLVFIGVFSFLFFSCFVICMGFFYCKVRCVCTCTIFMRDQFVNVVLEILY